MSIEVYIIQIAAILFVPWLILRRREKGLVKLFGTIAMAYFWGIVTAVAIWILNLCGLHISFSEDIGQIGSYACIGLAIPLLMFGSSLYEVRRLAKPVLISFSLLCLSVLIAVLILGRTIGASFPWGKEIAAMATGMYTGGSPNFNATGVILRVPGEIIALGNLSDMIVGTAFYIFILMAAKPLLGRFLDKHAQKGAYLTAEGDANNTDRLEWHGFRAPVLRNILLSLGCVAIGGGIGFVLWKIRGGALTDPLVPAIMITGTVLGLALSFVKPVREVRENGIVGHYLILVFSFALASSLDLATLTGDFLKIAGLLGCITVCTFVLHVLLCRMFHVDADCAIVTMTAGIYGPAFIPAVTKQLRNDSLTAPGLICGALGYALGTLLGSLIYLAL